MPYQLLGKSRIVRIREDLLDGIPEPEDLVIISQSDDSGPCMSDCVFCYIKQNPPEVLPPSGRVSPKRLDALNDPKIVEKVSRAKDFGGRIRITDVSGNFGVEESLIEDLASSGLDEIQISIHTTDPEIRKRMMGTPRAGEILELLPRMIDLGIDVIADLVVVPEYNLPGIEETIENLLELGCREIRLFPVGVTKLAGIRALNREELMYLKSLGELDDRIVISPTIRALLGESLVEKPISEIEPSIPIYLVCGELAAPTLRVAFPMLEIIPVRNETFGGNIGSSSLLTARDILRELRRFSDLPEPRLAVLPGSMLDEEGYTLDGVHIGELVERLILETGFLIEIAYSLDDIARIVELYS